MESFIPTDSGGRVWIHYGPPDEALHDKSRYYISAVDIIKGRINKDRLQGKLGIMGTSATGFKANLSGRKNARS